MERLIKARLNPNERKKVNSKKSGKWLCMSDDFGMVGVVLVKEDYPERLGYKMIQVCIFLTKLLIINLFTKIGVI